MHHLKLPYSDVNTIYRNETQQIHHELNKKYSNNLPILNSANYNQKNNYTKLKVEIVNKYDTYNDYRILDTEDIFYNTIFQVIYYSIIRIIKRNFLTRQIITEKFDGNVDKGVYKKIKIQDTDDLNLFLLKIKNRFVILNSSLITNDYLLRYLSHENKHNHLHYIDARHKFEYSVFNGSNEILVFPRNGLKDFQYSFKLEKTDKYIVVSLSIEPINEKTRCVLVKII